MSLLRKSQLKQTQKPLLPQSDLEEDDIVVDDDVTFGRNRQSKQFGKVVHEDDDLSDYVKIRLALARERALQAYRETKKDS